MLTDKIYQALNSSPQMQRQFKRIVLKLPHRQRQVEHFGQKLWIDPSELTGFYLYYEHDYDDYIFKFIDQRVKKYKIALDIGSNIGIYTVFLASRIPTVEAFEPEKRVLKKLRNNIGLNLLNNVNINEVCIGKASGFVNFVSPAQSNEGIGQITSHTDQGVQLPCISLDEFFNEGITVPCLIKMDIEGAEWLAIQGARRVLSNRQSNVDILIEIHPEEIADLGGTTDEMKSMIESLGFRIYGLTPDGLKPLLEEPNCRFWWVTSDDS